VDYVLCVRFDRRFAALTAQNFVSDLLVKRLGVQFLAVGDDFRFGAGRQGDFLLLQKAGLEYGFDVTSAMTFCEGGFASAARRCARRWPMMNWTRQKPCWGIRSPFPAAWYMAMLWAALLVSRRRIYRCVVRFPRLKGSMRWKWPDWAISLFGVANIGTRPTVAGVRQQLEVHLLDVVMDLYGRHIDVILRKKYATSSDFAG
jgi:riboflavin kinase/FMN adenylyltransferase